MVGPMVSNQLFFRPTRSDIWRVYDLVFLDSTKRFNKIERVCRSVHSVDGGLLLLMSHDAVVSRAILDVIVSAFCMCLV